MYCCQNNPTNRLNSKTEYYNCLKDLKKGTVLVTSQNHGFEVNPDSITSDIEITHISLFDKSIEGIKSKNGPFFGVQFHPEASPGPQESLSLFKDFTKMMKNHA